MKHVLQQGEFAGIQTRQEFARVVEKVVAGGEYRPLLNGRSAYYLDGTVVIRNPHAVDGGTAFVVDLVKYPNPRTYFEQVLK